ncbi:MAG: aminopeptidase P family N-terminal domain-containing protein, partial [Halioglobus sp.]|nr:aminopeptidase P family N-terminal domain-containing protein [Halioglobus sp.]
MEITPTAQAPDEAEIASRLDRVQEHLRRLGLDYYVCHDPANIFYLTNFANFVHERPFILVVPASGNLSFLMPKLEENHVRVRSVGPMEFVHYFEFPAPAGQMWSDRLRDILSGARRVGLESQCPLSVSEAIDCETLITDPVDAVRQVKSPFEINRIAYCARLL